MNNEIKYKVESLHSTDCIIGTLDELMGFKKALEQFFENDLEYFEENPSEENPYLNLYVKGSTNE